MAARNPILLGHAEEIDAVLPQVRAMLASEGFYIGADTAKPGFEVPLVVIGGKVFCMKIDTELPPEGFNDTLTLAGPFRAKGSPCTPPPDPDSLDAAKVLWGVVANAGRLSPQRQQRWGHVMDATARGSNSSAALCQRFGFDPDEMIGGESHD